MRKQNSIDVITSLRNFPYFVLRNEIKTGYSLYTQEIMQIKQNYFDYNKGADFKTEGSSGDYVPSQTRYKKIKTLIDREARYMFSQSPDFIIQTTGVDESEDKDIEQYQKLIDSVLTKNNFFSKLLKGAKDCFIGKRIAILVDYSEEDAVQTHFYTSLQFYYETEGDSDRITKFVSFEVLNKTKTNSQKRYLVNKYEDVDRTIYMSSIIYDGCGNIIEELITRTQIQLDYIPAVVILNDGTLEDTDGISEVEELSDLESSYSMLSNADVDTERKGMNPIRYVVDMGTETTANLSSGAGAFWDLRSDENKNEVHPMVGTLAPSMNHVEAVKTTLSRMEMDMYNELDMPNINQETMKGMITSGKALQILYFPLTVRCNEKLKVWKPALETVTRTIIDIAMLNKQETIGFYVLESFNEIQYNVKIIENYALIKDEEEEKQLDLEEIMSDARSRKSYIKKWRKDEFETDEQIEEELMQIAIEKNMFDTAGMNTQVSTEVNKRGSKTEVEENLEVEGTENILNNNKTKTEEVEEEIEEE